MSYPGKVVNTMARPKTGCTVMIDGAIYTAPKAMLGDYLMARLSGHTHASALPAISSVVSHPMFILSATATPVELAAAVLKIANITFPAVKK